ncbi:hypothetical protein B1748_08895 [Paenibacillus sp. MY03]|uniref:MvdC/MvdD family ATP grasp protein n=1 Tax=Paenibacillus sp. MY03 TaxID=302980 RepID=UPI000B3CA403|nr:hypothetical protein [Paenibacillus sp. MY03]OUS77251.1 hypothetical protein B1748_08895 [Paenibacillus sp. MY03]
MKPLLIITHSQDSTVSYIEKTYPRLYSFRLNTDKIDSYQISISGTGSTIRSSQWEISLENVHAIYYRKIVYPDLSDYDKEVRPLIAKELFGLIEGLAETFGDRCLSRPSLLKRAESKIVQLQLAKKLGFQLPLSLVTNHDQSAQAFVAPQPSIVKPLATGKLTTSIGDFIIQTNIIPSDEPPAHLSHCPSYFQAYVSKDYELRVTIIDTQVFAVRIDAGNEIDWRKSYESNTYLIVDIPEDITQKCFAMMKALQLHFGAFDFIVSGGEYIFLEINPNGQWLWLEQELNLHISNAIVQYLVQEEST